MTNFFGWLQNKLASDLSTSNIPSQYQFNNLTSNSGAVPAQYQFDNIDKPLFGDYDLGGQNAGKNTLKTGNTNKTNFASALLSGASLLGKPSGSTSTKPQFEVVPSRVDYSQFMGLSPVTQQYLTRYM